MISNSPDIMMNDPQVKGFRTWEQYQAYMQHPAEHLPQPPMPAGIHVEHEDIAEPIHAKGDGPFVVVATNPESMHRYTGPFKTHSEAFDWFMKDSEAGIWTYQIVPLEAP